VHVLSGQAQFDEHRNTSRSFAADPNLLPQLLEMLADARARGDEWIRWIDDGMPELTVEEYERVKPRRQSRRA
jgi:hypothetical protein